MNKIMIILVMILSSIFVVAEIPDGYYDDAQGLSGAQLKTALNSIIRNHQEYSYNALRDYILKDTDEDPNNSNNVILLYTGWSRSKEDFGGGISEWNREHVWAKSHGDFGTAMGPGTDAHHLRPTDVSVNSRRGNLDFDNGGSLYTDGDGTTGCHVDSDSWEPRDEVKGDVARMIFYMAVRYEGDSGEPDLEMVDYVNSSPDHQPYHGKESVLLQWHMDDPVDDWEISRNDKVYSYQNNRNPFIDHPEYVGAIWLGTGSDDSIITNHIQTKIYPNPFMISTHTRSDLQMEIQLQNPEKLAISLYNIRGRKVGNQLLLNLDKGVHSISIPTDSNQLSSGIYLINIAGEHNRTTEKFIIIR